MSIRNIRIGGSVKNRIIVQGDVNNSTIQLTKKVDYIEIADVILSKGKDDLKKYHGVEKHAIIDIGNNILKV
jgi:hypothetical protein